MKLFDASDVDQVTYILEQASKVNEALRRNPCRKRQDVYLMRH